MGADPLHRSAGLARLAFIGRYVRAIGSIRLDARVHPKLIEALVAARHVTVATTHMRALTVVALGNGSTAGAAHATVTPYVDD